MSSPCERVREGQIQKGSAKSSSGYFNIALHDRGIFAGVLSA